MCAQSYILPKVKKNSVLTREEENTPINFNAHGSFQDLGGYLECAGISQEAAKIIMESWRQSTKQQYGTHYKKWLCFCRQRQINHLNQSINEIICFLTHLHQMDLGYSSINTAKFVLSAMFEILFNEI